MTSLKKSFSLILVLLLGLILNGCAYNYIDDEGVKHIIGLVNVEIESPPNNSMYAGKIIDLRSFGISVNNINEGGGFSIGYSRDITGYIKNNALVLGNPFNFPSNIKDETNEN